MSAGKSTRIADAVHGTVVLEDAESRILDSQAFQRLRGVKQLGLAALTFPGADYSRFSHGVGTLHVMGQILTALEGDVPSSVSEEHRRAYRMAALLHDVGHFPFSHTFERALTDFYTSSTVIKPVGEEAGAGEAGALWTHEEMGSHVILSDSEVRAVLDGSGIDVDLVTNVITRATNPPNFANLISSDLDADRTDYLMRTAKHTGLPYGNVDLPYLLSQICLDADGFIAFKEKGMRAAEHLLLCRYFDYQQVSYHKTVAGMELVLNDAVAALLRGGHLACSGDDLQRMVSDGTWYGFDDAHVMYQLRAALNDVTESDPDRILYESIVRRWPPKVVFEREKLGTPAENRAFYNSMASEAQKKKSEWSDTFGVPFYVWRQKGTSLTKTGPTVPVSQANTFEPDSYDRTQQAVRIRRDDGTSCLIQEHPRSLMPVLSEQGLFSLRIYALLRPEQDDLRVSIQQRVQKDLSSFAEADT